MCIKQVPRYYTIAHQIEMHDSKDKGKLRPPTHPSLPPSPCRTRRGSPEGHPTAPRRTHQRERGDPELPGDERGAGRAVHVARTRAAARPQEPGHRVHALRHRLLLRSAAVGFGLGFVVLFFFFVEAYFRMNTLVRICERARTHTHART